MSFDILYDTFSIHHIQVYGFENDSIMQMRLKFLVMAEIVFDCNPRHYISCFHERNISDRPIQANTDPYRTVQACTSNSPGVLAELQLQPRKKNIKLKFSRNLK
jgi:hypothetical protein